MHLELLAAEEALASKVYITWRPLGGGADCARVGSASRCMCGHTLKEHMAVNPRIHDLLPARLSAGVGLSTSCRHAQRRWGCGGFLVAKASMSEPGARLAVASMGTICMMSRRAAARAVVAVASIRRISVSVAMANRMRIQRCLASSPPVILTPRHAAIDSSSSCKLRRYLSSKLSEGRPDGQSVGAICHSGGVLGLV